MSEVQNIESIVNAYIILFNTIISDHSEKIQGKYFTRKFMPIHSKILTSINDTPTNDFDIELLPKVNEQIPKCIVDVKYLYSYVDKKKVYEAIFTPK